MMGIDTEYIRAVATTAPATDVRKDLHKCCQEIDRLRAELENMTDEADSWEEVAYRHQEERNRAEARVRELEEAFNESIAFIAALEDNPYYDGPGGVDYANELKALANSEKE